MSYTIKEATASFKFILDLPLHCHNTLKNKSALVKICFATCYKRLED